MPAWALECYREFTSILDHDQFPCIFAKHVNRLHSAWFHFAEGIGSDADRALVREAVLAYFEVLDAQPRAKALFMPLIVAVKSATRDLPLSEYHGQAWALFQYLHDTDPEPWPAEVSRDPEHGSWSFCFAGRQLFSNVSCPAHKVHRSRNIGSALTFVMQPRMNFDVVAGNNPGGRRIRAEIRRRIEVYEGSPPPAELGYFGSEDNREWRQMTVPDGTEPFPTRCPFRFDPQT